jgi:hypothetical protein
VGESWKKMKYRKETTGPNNEQGDQCRYHSTAACSDRWAPQETPDAKALLSEN